MTPEELEQYVQVGIQAIKSEGPDMLLGIKQMESLEVLIRWSIKKGYQAALADVLRKIDTEDDWAHQLREWLDQQRAEGKKEHDVSQVESWNSTTTKWSTPREERP